MVNLEPMKNIDIKVTLLHGNNRKKHSESTQLLR
jgi:hypothetical protein